MFIHTGIGILILWIGSAIAYVGVAYDGYYRILLVVGVLVGLYGLLWIFKER